MEKTQAGLMNTLLSVNPLEQAASGSAGKHKEGRQFADVFSFASNNLGSPGVENTQSYSLDLMNGEQKNGKPLPLFMLAQSSLPQTEEEIELPIAAELAGESKGDLEQRGPGEDVLATALFSQELGLQTSLGKPSGLGDNLEKIEGLPTSPVGVLGKTGSDKSFLVTNNGLMAVANETLAKLPSHLKEGVLPAQKLMSEDYDLINRLASDLPIKSGFKQGNLLESQNLKGENSIFGAKAERQEQLTAILENFKLKLGPDSLSKSETISHQQASFGIQQFAKMASNNKDWKFTDSASIFKKTEGLSDAKLASLSSLDIDKVTSLIGQVKAEAMSSGQSQANSVTSATLIEGNAHNLSKPVEQQLASVANPTRALSLNNQLTPGLSMQIQWMVRQAVSSAEIMMDPPEMGPLSVKVQQHNGETSILFQVANQSTKDALTDNLPRLKEMLMQQGINIGDAEVEHQKQESDADDQDSSNQSESKSSLDQLANKTVSADEALSVNYQLNGLVDLYS